jgi:hypothetical protein
MDAKQFLANLPAWDSAECLAHLDKDAVLSAQVRLPVAPGFTGRLVPVKVRRPYRAQIELIAVDASRLPAP